MDKICLVIMFGFHLYMCNGASLDIELQCATTQQPPKMTRYPKGLMYFRAGETLSLECEASGNPAPTFSWSKNGEVISGETSSVLKIKDAGIFDEAVYRCRASSSYGTAISPLIDVRNAFSNSAPLQQPAQYTVTQGQSVEFTCQTGSSDPKPYLSWVVKTDPVDPYPRRVNLDRRVHTNYEGKLYFSNVVRSDAPTEGQLYQCQAYNYVTDTTRGGSYARLTVQPVEYPSDVPPRMMHTSPPEVIGVVSEDISLFCIFSGYPTPTVIWRKQGGPLPPKHSFYIAASNTSLTLHDLDDSHIGTYTCTGTNRAASASIEITVIKRQRPVWTARPFDQSGRQGANAQMTCQAQGIPAPSLEWFHNGVKLDGNNMGPRRSIQGDGSLIIMGVVPNDMGTYQCNQSNVHGYIFAEATLVVRCLDPSSTTHPVTVPPPPPVPSCPRGFIQSDAFHSCYKFLVVAETMTWFEAGHFCTMYAADFWARNVHLVAIESMDEQNYLLDQIRGNPLISGQTIWTSGHNLERQVNFTWGRILQSVSIPGWAPDKPEGAGSCLVMDAALSHQWNNVACSSKLNGIICESDLIQQ